MLDRLLKLWPLLTVVSLTVVSVFNIGYFSIIGLHFIGVVDLTNIVYSVGLVFGFVIAPLMMFPDNLIEALKAVAAKPDAPYRLNKAMKYITAVLVLSFTIGLFIHQPYISIMGLFAIYFVAACLISAGYAYAMWLHIGDIPPRIIFGLVAAGLFTIMWVGGWVAHNQAFGSPTLYKVTTKDSEYDKVRLVRSSSSGFIIARDKQIIYLPAGELKSIVQVSGM